MKTKRNIKAILANPVLRKEMMVNTIIALQAIEGISTSREQAEHAYDMILLESSNYLHNANPTVI